MMSSKSKMVMPPIYRFEFANNPIASKWGWHRATDLVEVVNNIRDLRGEKSLSAYQICWEYDTIDPDQFSVAIEPLMGDCEVWYGVLRSIPQGWLYQACHSQCFIPAKLGMMLLEQVKDPNRTFLKKVRAKMEELVA